MTRIRWTLACTLLVLGHGARGAPPADIDAHVGRAMQRFEVPGMAVAIVEDGKTTFAKGYGVRKLGNPQRTDEHTAFPLGSCGKAFTTAALAILVDEGKLAWGDKVADRLVGFRMYDDYATVEMTTRDLLVHNSGLGLGAGDMLFYPPTNFTRQEVVERLRHIKPATSFRSGYAYDNVLYIAAGRMVEQISGQSWESFIERRIFEPLGMRDSVPAPDHLRDGDNYAWPHARIDGRVRGMGSVVALAAEEEMRTPDVAAPAGSIMASAVDVARWLQVQMDQGAIAGTNRRLFSAAAAQEMWTPRVIQPAEQVPEPIATIKPNIDTYALGWEVRDYRGHKLVAHSGAVEGSLAAVALLPAKRVAIAVMINSEDGGARWAVYYRLLDHYLGLSSGDWVEAYAQVRKQQNDSALQALAAGASDTPTGKSQPPLPQAAYAGVYRDAWYGTMTVTNADKLRIRFDRTPSMNGELQHLRHNTFRTRWDDRRVEDAYVTFALDHDGNIDHVTMKAISPLADFSMDYHDLLFRPVRP